MNYIVDDIEAVVDLMKVDAILIAKLQAGLAPLSKKGYLAEMPYYMYGHKVEIAERLTEMGDDKVYKYQKYPLVVLRLDTPEENNDGVIHYTLNIALMMLTDKNWNAKERYVNVFKPVIYPMYESFFRCLKKVSRGFMWEKKHDLPPHTKIDRPYWGTSEEGGNTANIFNDPLDAIELINLKLTQNYKC